MAQIMARRQPSAPSPPALGPGPTQLRRKVPLLQGLSPGMRKCSKSYLPRCVVGPHVYT